MSLVLIKKAFVNAYLQKNDSDEFTLSDPLTPYIEDFNCGWVGTGNGIWTYEKPSQCYSDIYQVLGGHKYFLTLGEEAGTRFRIMFTTTDVSTVASGTVSGKAVNTSNYNNPSPYQNVYYTTPSDGYIVFQKDNAGKSGIKTYVHDTISKSPVVCYFLGEVNPHSFNSEKILQIVEALKTVLNSSVQVKAVKKVEGYIIGHTDLAALTVTQLPSKTQYRAGELADYTGIAVTATYENGSIVDVTDKAVFSPAHGETVSSPVSVSFKELSTTFNLNITGAVFTQLLVTPPNKTTYLKGEALDFTGCFVTVTYVDGSTKDVTDKAVFSHKNGTVPDDNDIDENNNLPISVSYQEGEDIATTNFTVKVTYLERIILTKPTRTSYYVGDTLDYTGLKVEAVYKNANTVDVTDKAVITPPDGAVITKDMTTQDYVWEYKLKINAYYTDAISDKKTASTTLILPHHELTSPVKTTYHVGEALDYTGLNLKIDGVDVTSKVTFMYPEGTVIPNSWLEDDFRYRQYGGYASRGMPVYYTDASGTVEDTYFDIRIYPEPQEYLNLITVTPPAKTHHIGDALDYTGVQVIAEYSLAGSVDVTSSAVISPAEGTVITKDIVAGPIVKSIGSYYQLQMKVSYTDSENRSRTTSRIIEIPHLTVTAPTKTNYHVGEALDYTGLKVELDGEDITSSLSFEYPEGYVIPDKWFDPEDSTDKYTEQKLYLYYTNLLGYPETTYCVIKAYP